MRVCVPRRKLIFPEPGAGMCLIFHENPQLGSHKDYGEGKASPGIGSVSGSLVSAVCVSAAQPQSYRLARAHSERRAFLCICVCLSLIGMGHGGWAGKVSLGGPGACRCTRNANTGTGCGTGTRALDEATGAARLMCVLAVYVDR